MLEIEASEADLRVAEEAAKEDKNGERAPREPRSDWSMWTEGGGRLVFDVRRALSSWILEGSWRIGAMAVRSGA